MSRFYCPHCQIPLPRTVTRCPSCHRSIDTDAEKKRKAGIRSLALGPTHTLDTVAVPDEAEQPPEPVQERGSMISLREQRASSSQLLDQPTLPSQQAWSTKEMNIFEPHSQEVDTDDTFRMAPGHGLADFSPATSQNPTLSLSQEFMDDDDIGEETAQVLTKPSFGMMPSASLEDMFQPIKASGTSSDTLPETMPLETPSGSLMGNIEHIGIRGDEPPPEEPTRRMPAPVFTLVDGHTDAAINPSMNLDVDPSEADMTAERPFINRASGEDTFTGLLSTLGMEESKRNDLTERAEAKKVVVNLSIL